MICAIYVLKEEGIITNVQEDVFNIKNMLDFFRVIKSIEFIPNSIENDNKTKVMSKN